MPHHHDWHHEGNKGSNYTFSSIGGVWDCIFLTRHEGRSKNFENQASSVDRSMTKSKEYKTWIRPKKGFFDTPFGSLLPVGMVLATAACKLMSQGFRVGLEGKENGFSK